MAAAQSHGELYRTSKAEQCVPFARRVSGIEIYGDAHTWWKRAKPHYQCGNIPAIGAVLSMPSTKKLPNGHVAVVKRIVDSRTIEVAHSNWGDSRSSRKIVYNNMRVRDISTHNDWSRVKFWNYDINSYGLPYAANGFIYK